MVNPINQGKRGRNLSRQAIIASRIGNRVLWAFIAFLITFRCRYQKEKLYLCQTKSGRTSRRCILSREPAGGMWNTLKKSHFSLDCAVRQPYEHSYTWMRRIHRVEIWLARGFEKINLWRPKPTNTLKFLVTKITYLIELLTKPDIMLAVIRHKKHAVLSTCGWTGIITFLS